MKHLFPLGLRLALVALGLVAGCTSRPSKEPPIRVRWTRDPESLDPLLLANQYATEAANLLHLSLLQVDFSKNDFSPALAEALPTVTLLGDSLTQLTYQLRQAAAWDNGQPITGHDVALTLKLMYCPGLPNESARAQAGFIRSIRIDSLNPKRFTLTCQGQAVEHIQASGDFFILPETVLDPQHELRPTSLSELQKRPPTTPPDSALSRLARRYLAAVPMPGSPAPALGCGPYELSSWQKNQTLRLRRKTRWWADQVRPRPFVLQAQPRRLEFAIIPDDATAALALQHGDIDLYPQVSAAQFAQLRASETTREQLAFYTAPSYDIVAAGFNTQQPALADGPTRRALSYLFDAAGLLQATQFGQGLRTVGLIHPNDQRNYNRSLSLLPFAPDTAALLLRRAGWQQTTPRGPWQRQPKAGARQQLRLRFRYRADDASFETMALQFRAAAASVGIAVELLPTAAAALTPNLQAGDFDVYVRLIKGNPFLFNFIPVLHSSARGAGNFTGYGTPASDQLIEAIAAARQPAQRSRLLQQFQATLRTDAPVVPLFFMATRLAASRQLAGLHVSHLKPGYLVTTMERKPASFPTP
ncbi:ABC transporter substrate-binding protein [Hymenobacter sp. ASUV-10]|uniref:ABC transporter substrate-binding protein n=1 Tax=Hymenobacter aranciens TaxID=3063996 RepID=A0ABT9B8K6_9BACT|nr:ABC transporter substrate-binding protein [Hymenobacter sp. ASUV-10]MDO7874606.1 ABC transporter substrate-binding protein [Hymenobacter sp. ASUV-10]